MLSAKPWKTDAILRLVSSIVLSFLAGSFISTALRYRGAAGVAGLKFWVVTGGALMCLGAALVLVRREWRLEGFALRVTLLLLCLYGGLFLGAWGQKIAGQAGPSLGQMVVALLSFQGAALVWESLFLREHGMSWQEGFGFRQHWLHCILLGIIVACVFLPIGLGLKWVSAEVVVRLHFKPEEQQVVQTLQMDTAGPSRLIFGLFTVLLVPPAEEAMFRGIFYPWVKQAGYPRLALWGTAAFFGAVHLNLISFIPLTLLAVALTLLYERTDNLLAPITTHALFNAVNFALLYLPEERLFPVIMLALTVILTFVLALLGLKQIVAKE
ncbi:MAG TPA: CPBP family intramembrane glutamic endopeptidase [Verrucomicrobiae bacterium]|nr:CPBP family intramembrane glutamic endopeptidase [Verrucomicrobiae bacterium]